MKINTAAVVILSGGMDSTTLLYNARQLHQSVYAISFDYSQKHKKELSMAKATCELLGVPHKICNLQVLNEVAPSALTRTAWEVPEGHYAEESMKQTVVPNRNMVMLSLAISYAISLKAPTVYYGAHSGDHDIYPDCRPEFVEALAKTALLADWFQVCLEAPYLNMTKGDIAALGSRLGVDYSLTWTCYKGQEVPCGKCGACVEREEAFAFAGVTDPLTITGE